MNYIFKKIRKKIPNSRFSITLLYSFFLLIFTNVPILLTRVNIYEKWGFNYLESIYYLFFEMLFIYSLNVVWIGFLILFPKPINKILIFTSTIISGLTVYIAVSRGVFVNEELVSSIFTTNLVEAQAQISIIDLLIAITFVLIPIIFLCMVDIKSYSKPNLKNILIKLITILAIILVGTVIPNETVFKSHNDKIIKGVGAAYPPSNYVAAVFTYFTKLRLTQKELENLPSIVNGNNEFSLEKPLPKKLNVVLIIGETARSKSHGFAGYSRNTTPIIENIYKNSGVGNNPYAVLYPNVKSCGTYTVLSVPCMISRYGAEDFSLPIKEQSIISVFKYLGFKTYWLGTQGAYGSESLGTNILTSDEYLVRHQMRHNIIGDRQVLDGDMLPYIKSFSEQGADKKMMVVHLTGSHEPYDRSYPKEFEKWENDGTDAVRKINTYDNSILYTDYVISEIIRIFNDAHEPFLIIYTPDHGESFGELYNGRSYFGHGADRNNAPDEQTRVVMYFFVNDLFLKDYPLNIKRMQNESNEYISHDYVYNTLLDCIGVDSNTINKKLSLCSLGR